MPDKYYGIYLLPPASIVYAISLAHRVFEAEFGAITAGRFMAHCTVKGFTKLSVPAESLILALDTYFAKTSPFETDIKPPWLSTGDKPGESILLWLEKTPQFQQFHNDVLAIIKPHVADDCLFTPNEWLGESFPPHLTLVQSDLSPDPALLAQAMDLANYIYDNFPARSFLAQQVQLVEFESDDWTGTWARTLRFRQIKAWRLGAANLSNS